jgi:SAM-dependent methyltransferase
MGIWDNFHQSKIHSRRVSRLVDNLQGLIPLSASVLDVGCGDALLTKALAERRPDGVFAGIEVFLRKESHLPVMLYDGKIIPFKDNSYDVVLLVDVLHHVKDPIGLLRQAQRVAKQYVLLKDHAREGLLAGPQLRFMDWWANRRHGISAPATYWSREEWDRAFRELKMSVEMQGTDLRLYVWPADLVFGRSLHFVAKIKV